MRSRVGHLMWGFGGLAAESRLTLRKGYKTEADKKHKEKGKGLKTQRETKKPT